METVLHWYLVGLVVNVLVVYSSYLYDTFKRRTYKLRKDDYMLFILAIVMSWSFYIVLIVNGIYSLMLKVKR